MDSRVHRYCDICYLEIDSGCHVELVLGSFAAIIRFEPLAYHNVFRRCHRRSLYRRDSRRHIEAK